MGRPRRRRPAKAPIAESSHLDHEKIPPNTQRDSPQRMTPRHPTTSTNDLCYFCNLKVEITSLDEPCSMISCRFAKLDINVGDKITNPVAPEIVEEDRLCRLCSQLDFERIFMPLTQPGKDLPVPSQHRRSTCVLNRDMSLVQKHSRCPFCRLLLNTIQLNDGIDFSKHVVLRGYVEEFSVAHKFSRSTPVSLLGRRLWIVGLDKTQYTKVDDSWSPLRDMLETEFTHCIQLRSPISNSAQRCPQGTPRGRKIGRGQIDMKRISKWLSICESSHSKCRQSPKEGRDRDFTLRVIDVEQGCIVDAAPGCRYIALSYVWGGANQVELSKETYSILTKSGSITPLTTNIPRTIRDAMLLCQGIGQRFLWVDALCILQDVPEDKHSQIMNMDRIYSSALLTLVDGFGSDANAGLPGVRPNSRLVNQCTGYIDDMKLLSVRHDLWPALKDSAWFSRGWTFQEYVLSKRVLLFVSGTVIFLCQKAFWKEDTALEDPGMKSTTRECQRFLPCGLGISASAISPDKAETQCNNLISAYSTRKLTREDDILNAFEGILNNFTPVLGDFISGLPEKMLCTSLLWRNKDNNPPRERRNCFPSWSWTGWKHHSSVMGACNSTNLESELAIYKPLEDGSDVIAIKASIRHKHNPFIPKYRNFEPLGQHKQIKKTERLMNILSLNKTLLSQILIFWTSSAFIQVDHLPQRNDESHEFDSINGKFEIHSGSDATNNAFINLNKKWRALQPDKLEFILIASNYLNYVPFLDILLIERVGQISRRVNVPIYSQITESDWMRHNPEKTLIFFA